MTTTDLKIVPLGVGDTFSAYNTTASLLIEAEGFRLGIDCPDSYRRVLQQAADKSGSALPIETIDDILITHVHGDHMNGLEGFAFWKHFVEKKRVNLWTSPDARAVIWDQRLIAPMEQLFDGKSFHKKKFEDYFAYSALEWDQATQIGPFRVTTRRTIHHIPTSALLIEWAGGKLGYSADTAFDPGLIKFFETADLIIHETNYGPAHTAYADLAALPEDLRKKMRLIHYPDTLDLSNPTITPLAEGKIELLPRRHP
jgi:ribonuclease BN (tRNA processing enzyme)